MVISLQAQLILDAYAATVGGRQDVRYTNVIDVIQKLPLRLRQLFVLGSTLVLTACAATTPSSPLSSSSAPIKEKTMMTSTSTAAQQAKRSLDGSKPFTMPEIEERLLQLFALPPAQINIETVERIFGVVLEGRDIPTFYEEISDDRQVAFSVNAFRPVPGGMVFNYEVKIKSTNSEGRPIMESNPRKIPTAYKFAYLPFVQKLQQLGWQLSGEYRNVGIYWSDFKKDGFLLKLYIDDYLGTAYDPPDYSQTGIPRIVIRAPLNLQGN